MPKQKRRLKISPSRQNNVNTSSIYFILSITQQHLTLSSNESFISLYVLDDDLFQKEFDITVETLAKKSINMIDRKNYT